ncbi:hypothetical protein BJF96_g9274 [Verticillium dahliae]|uniref:Uncharacterized protein n=1 Tax=Verticillium dahliae TaxID=27337 RepID=A0AA44WDJ9_VERDA|nr:hypothetical protein BJF96_g9274 [Verticillium dahliae]
MQDTILATFEGIAGMDGRGVELACTLDTDSPATKFHPDCIGAVEKAADGLVGRDGWLHITSGAGHDSVYTSRRCPTTMIFCRARTASAIIRRSIAAPRTAQWERRHCWTLCSSTTRAEVHERQSRRV